MRELRLTPPNICEGYGLIISKDTNKEVFIRLYTEIVGHADDADVYINGILSLFKLYPEGELLNYLEQKCLVEVIGNARSMRDTATILERSVSRITQILKNSIEKLRIPSRLVRFSVSAVQELFPEIHITPDTPYEELVKLKKSTELYGFFDSVLLYTEDTMPLSELNLPAIAHHSMTRSGYQTLSDIIERGYYAVREIHNIGEEVCSKIAYSLQVLGYTEWGKSSSTKEKEEEEFYSTHKKAIKNIFKNTTAVLRIFNKCCLICGSEKLGTILVKEFLKLDTRFDIVLLAANKNSLNNLFRYLGARNGFNCAISYADILKDESDFLADKLSNYNAIVFYEIEEFVKHDVSNIIQTIKSNNMLLYGVSSKCIPEEGVEVLTSIFDEEVFDIDNSLSTSKDTN